MRLFAFLAGIVLATVGMFAAAAESTPRPAHLDLMPTTTTARPAQQPGATQQVITVHVRGGGPLRVEPETVVVPPQRGGARRLPEIRVVDPRGTLAGWTVSARAGTDRSVRLKPTAPAAVAGDPAGLHAGPSARLADGVVLGWAEPGHGGGTYELGGTITGGRPGEPVEIRLTVR